MTKQNTINRFSKYTRAEALEFAIDCINEHCGDANDVIEVLNKLYASITKPRKKSDAPSKTRIENVALVDAACAAMGNNSVSSKWLTEHVNGIMTTQKAAAVMRLGVELGKVIKTTEGRKVSYRVA